MNNEHETKDYDQLRDLLKDIKFTMVAFEKSDGSGLRSCPMTTQEADKNGDLWFIIGKQTELARSLNSTSSVCLAYSEPKDTRFISVQGQAEVLEDRAKAKELWNPIYKAWFPEGLEDPNLAVMKVSVQEAEYWDTKTGKFVQLIGFAKALMTGQKYKTGPGEHGKIEVRH